MTEAQQEPMASKKGLSPLAWVLIVIGGLLASGLLVATLLFAFVFRAVKDVAADFKDDPARAAAEMVVKMNPDLELVETDDEAGTITVRNQESGEVATLDFSDLADGEFGVTTDEGEFAVSTSAGAAGGVTVTGPDGVTTFGSSADLDNVPEWVPIYPNASETQGTMNSKTPEGSFGIVSQQTQDGSKAVMSFFKDWLESSDYEIANESTMSVGDGTMSAIVGELREQGRSVNVAVIEQDGEGTQITINYNQKNN